MIKSLNQAEIRHFHRLAHLHRAESPHYYCYFVSLKKLETFSPEQEWELIKDEPYANKLAVLKRQLLEKLLYALDDLHRSNDPEEQIKAHFHETYILLKKQLPKAAASRLKKAKRLLEQHGHFQLWPAYHQILLRLTEQWVRSGKSPKAHEQPTDWQAHLQQTTAQYEAQRQKVELYKNRFRNLSSETADIGIQISPDAHPAVRADQLQAAALNAFSKGNPLDASRHNAALLSDLQTLDQANKTVPERILSTTYNLLLDYLHLSAYEQLTAGLEQLRALPQQKAFRRLPRIESRVFEWGFQLELNVYARQKKWASGFSRLDKLLEGIEKHQEQLSAPAFASLHLLGGLMAFHHGNYDKALALLQPLYQAIRPGSARDVYRYARYLHLLCHLQLEHYETAESLLTGIKRAFSYNASPAELDFFDKSARILRNTNEKKAILRNWSMAFDSNSDLERYLTLSEWLATFA